ncbi:MAG: hypothetical protein AMXMBFR60_31170 [Chloroflexota bacterium]
MPLLLEFPETVADKLKIAGFTVFDMYQVSPEEIEPFWPISEGASVEATIGSEKTISNRMG